MLINHGALKFNILVVCTNIKYSIKELQGVALKKIILIIDKILFVKILTFMKS